MYQHSTYLSYPFLRWQPSQMVNYSLPCWGLKHLSRALCEWFIFSSHSDFALLLVASTDPTAPTAVIHYALGKSRKKPKKPVQCSVYTLYAPSLQPSSDQGPIPQSCYSTLSCFNFSQKDEQKTQVKQDNLTLNSRKI